MPSQEETPCPGCTGPLKDVVTGTCGHTFSRSRLLPPSQMGAQPSCQVLLCVLCKEKEPTKPLVVPVPLGPLGETCCEEHGEKVYFFCETDAEFLCVACREGPSHRTHAVGVLDGAAQPYRVRQTAFPGASMGWDGVLSTTVKGMGRDLDEGWWFHMDVWPFSLGGPRGQGTESCSHEPCAWEGLPPTVDLVSQDPPWVWDLLRPRLLGSEGCEGQTRAAGRCHSSLGEGEAPRVPLCPPCTPPRAALSSLSPSGVWVWK